MKEKLSFRNYISGNRRTMVLLGMFVTAFFLIRLPPWAMTRMNGWSLLNPLCSTGKTSAGIPLCG